MTKYPKLPKIKTNEYQFILRRTYVSTKQTTSPRVLVPVILVSLNQMKVKVFDFKIEIFSIFILTSILAGAFSCLGY